MQKWAFCGTKSASNAVRQRQQMLEVRCSSMGIESAVDGVCMCVEYEYYPSCKVSRTEKERGRGRERERKRERSMEWVAGKLTY